MFDAAECLFLYVESSLRVGGAEDGDDIDLPIQREPATGYPVVPASSLKGALRRAHVCSKPRSSCWGCSARRRKARNHRPRPATWSSRTPSPSFFRSARWSESSPGRPASRPWRRFRRNVAGYGVKVAPLPEPPALDPETAGVPPECPLLSSKQTLVLEELSFPIRVAKEVGSSGAWLAEHAFPQEPVFDFWRAQHRAGNRGVAGRGLSSFPGPRHPDRPAHPDGPAHGDGGGRLALDRGVPSAGDAALRPGGDRHARDAPQGDQEGF